MACYVRPSIVIPSALIDREMPFVFEVALTVICRSCACAGTTVFVFVSPVVFSCLASFARVECFVDFAGFVDCTCSDSFGGCSGSFFNMVEADSMWRMRNREVSLSLARVDLFSMWRMCNGDVCTSLGPALTFRRSEEPNFAKLRTGLSRTTFPAARMISV
jgi:hypothetical protein